MKLIRTKGRGAKQAAEFSPRSKIAAARRSMLFYPLSSAS